MSDVQKITVRLLAAPREFSPAAFVPVLHRWIQTKAIADHLLIDVADYAHVPSGPGTLLVALEANIHVDRSDPSGRIGLEYSRKRPLPGDFGQRLRTIVATTLGIADRLQREPELDGQLVFPVDRLTIQFNDRLNAPNQPSTYQQLEPEIRSLADALFGPGAKVESGAPQGDLAEFRIAPAGAAPSLSALIDRLGVTAPVPA